MVGALQEAIAEVRRLPEEVQEKIGEELLLHVDKLRRLRAKIDKGIASLNHGQGRVLDIDEIITRARAQHARS